MIINQYNPPVVNYGSISNANIVQYMCFSFISLFQLESKRFRNMCQFHVNNVEPYVAKNNDQNMETGLKYEGTIHKKMTKEINCTAFN